MKESRSEEKEEVKNGRKERKSKEIIVRGGKIDGEWEQSELFIGYSVYRGSRFFSFKRGF